MGVEFNVGVEPGIGAWGTQAVSKAINAITLSDKRIGLLKRRQPDVFHPLGLFLLKGPERLLNFVLACSQTA